MTTTKQFSVLLFTLAVIFVFSFSAFAITLKEEDDIAKEFISQVKTHYKIVSDPEIADYISDLGEKVLAQYPEQPFKYNFYVIKDDIYNAFAGPGGHIFINSGLFAALDNEEALAGIIGHEISHVACRHISERIDRAGKIGLSTIAGVAAGIFMSIYGDPAAGTALTVGSIAGGQSLSLAYSRKDEIQADRVGLKYLNDAGYSGRGLIDGLTQIRSRQWFGSDQIPVYLTTHPALEDRMSYIKNWVETHEKNRKKPMKSSFEFNMAHTKVVAKYTDIQKANTIFKNKLEQDENDLFANYGYGIILSRTGKYDKAIGYLKRALEKRAFHTGMIETLGRVYFDNGDYKKAKNIFEGILSIDPGNFEYNLIYSRCLAETGELDRAINGLRTFTSEENGKRKAFYYLADIYARKKMMVDSYYYLGLFYKANKDMRNALIQLERALSIVKDPLKKQKITNQLTILKDGKKKKPPKKNVDPSSDLLHD